MVKLLKGKRLFLGLSDENMARLKQDQPIKFNLKDLGLQDLEVVIFNGKTEAAIVETLSNANLIVHPTNPVTKPTDSTKN